MSKKSIKSIERLEPRQLFAEVTGLTLINAQTDQPVPGFTLTNGAIIDLALTGRQLNIRADMAAGSTGSVRFNLDGNPNFKIESVAPFAVSGDANNGKDFLPWTPTLGTHALVVTPYSAAAGSGARGGSKMLTFQVIDSNPVASTALRINAGGGIYTDTAGNVFGVDAGFSSSSVKSSSVYPVADTLADPLYQTRRFGAKFTFTRPVDNGTYTLKLHFAEPSFAKANQRKFDVSAEGKLTIDDLDLVKAVGAKRALVKSFPVTISDGKLDLAFAASINNAIISAIELLPTSAPTANISVPASFFINAGGPATTDSGKRIFEGDSYFTGGTTGGTLYDVQGTADDAIFSTAHSGTSFSFSRPVANGHYSLWLEFADATAQTAGERTFDVTGEGVQLLNDFDIYAAAGAGQTAVARKFDVNVSDGLLDLSFEGVVGDATVSAIVLIPTDVPPAIQWYVGMNDYSDPVKHNAALEAWKMISASNLRQIGQGILLYSNDHRGKYPPDLATMFANVDIGLSAFADPRVPTLLPRGEMSALEKAAWIAEQQDYLYVGNGLNNTAGETVIVAYENPDRISGDDLMALFGDGHVAAVPRATIVAQFGGSSVSPTPLPRPADVSIDPAAATASNTSATNLRKISDAMFMYSNNFRGFFPPDFGSLYPSYGVTADNFHNPRGHSSTPPAGMDQAQTIAWINNATDYGYLVAGQRSFKVTTAMAYENPAEVSLGIHILLKDGSVEFREMTWAIQTLAAAGAPRVI